MSTNKNAQIRYTILDRCFSNFNRQYTYTDLLHEINGVLFNLDSEGIQLRQLQYDISHMKSNEGYSIELKEGLKKGKRRLFRYANRKFSIADHPLNQDDSEQLEITLAILSRYKHREEFKWLEELIPRMEMAFDLVEKGENGIISYEENQDLKGREYVGQLFNQIVKKKVVEIEYRPFGKDSEILNIHPYHLKQYNNRWFLICYNEKYQALSNYPLDRIKAIRETGLTFLESSVNWIDYFDDIVGVTKPIEMDILEVRLKFSSQRIDYVLTKPIHGTQKIDKSDNSGLTIKIEVVPNPELYQLILSFGEDVEVISPTKVRTEIMSKIRIMNKTY